MGRRKRRLVPGRLSTHGVEGNEMKAEQAIRTLKRRVQLHAIQAEHIHAGKNQRYKGRAEALRMVEAWIKELYSPNAGSPARRASLPNQTGG